MLIEIPKVVELIVKKVNPERIYLTGYTGLEDKVVNIYFGNELPKHLPYVKHIDVLILKRNAYDHVLYVHMGKLLKTYVTNTVWIMGAGHFEGLLNKGNFFAFRTVQAGQMIYNSSIHKLKASPKADMDGCKKEANKEAFHAYYIANSYLDLAGKYQNQKKKAKILSILQLYQAAGLYIRAAIKFVLGIDISPEINLSQLISLGRWASPELFTIFDFNKKEDKEMLKLIELAQKRVATDVYFALDYQFIIAVREKVKLLRKMVILLMDLNNKTLENIGFNKDDGYEAW